MIWKPGKPQSMGSVPKALGISEKGKEKVMFPHMKGEQREVLSWDWIIRTCKLKIMHDKIMAGLSMAGVFVYVSSATGLSQEQEDYIKPVHSFMEMAKSTSSTSNDFKSMDIIHSR